MKKFYSLLVVASLVALSGCGAKNDEEAAKAVQEGLVNLSGVESGSFEMVISGEMSGDFGVDSGEVSFNADMSGAYDNSESDNPEFSFKVDAEATVPEIGEQNFGAEIRLSGNDMYFVLNGISDFGGQLPSVFVAPFLNQWFVMTLPEEYAETLATYNAEESEMTEEEKALKDLFEQTVMFTGVKDKGSEEIDGVATTHYTVELDKEALTTYLAGSMKIVGDELNEADIEELKSGLEAFDFSGDVWITEADKTFKKLSGTIVIHETEGVSGELAINYTMGNIGEEIVVEIPEGAEEFDPLTLMGGGF